MSKHIVTQDEERRAVGGDGFGFAPLPQFAENGQCWTAEGVAAFDAPNGIEIGGAETGGFVNEACAGFFVPGEAALLLEFKLEPGCWDSGTL